MITQSSNNPTVVMWCNAVQYIQFPIKGESVSWRLHKLMCLETDSGGGGGRTLHLTVLCVNGDGVLSSRSEYLKKKRDLRKLTF